MSRMQRDKGKAGEREAAELVRELTGWDVRRRVRQHDGDSDLTGAPGWAVEVKRHRTATRGDLAQWWAQTVAQAGDLLPVLLYRADRAEWRAVWPLAVCLTQQLADYWRGVEWTADTRPLPRGLPWRATVRLRNRGKERTESDARTTRRNQTRSQPARLCLGAAGLHGASAQA